MKWKFENSDGSSFYVREFPSMPRVVAYAKNLAMLSGDIITVYRETLLADDFDGRNKESWHRYGYAIDNTWRRFQ